MTRRRGSPVVASASGHSTALSNRAAIGGQGQSGVNERLSYRHNSARNHL